VPLLVVEQDVDFLLLLASRLYLVNHVRSRRSSMSLTAVSAMRKSWKNISA